MVARLAFSWLATAQTICALTGGQVADGGGFWFRLANAPMRSCLSGDVKFDRPNHTSGATTFALELLLPN